MAFEQSLKLVRDLSEHRLRRDPNARKRILCVLGEHPSSYTLKLKPYQPHSLAAAISPDDSQEIAEATNNVHEQPVMLPAPEVAEDSSLEEIAVPSVSQLED